MFRQLRLQKNMESFRFHFEKMAILERYRSDYQEEGRREFVLATNYELISHASRALVALRKVEELAGESTPQIAIYRRYCSALQELPAIARSEIDTTPQSKIDGLYSTFETHTWPSHPFA